jgi:hypothetical protein
VRAGADVNVRSPYSGTAGWWAARWNRRRFRRELWKYYQERECP